MEPSNEPQETRLTFPKRPQPSPRFKAQPISLVSNHYTLSLSPQFPSIYLYDIKIIDVKAEGEIPADDRSRRGAVLKAASDPKISQPSLTELFGTNCWPSGLVLWSLKNHTSPKTIKTTKDNNKYEITLTKAKEVSLRADTFQNNQTASKALQYLNVIYKRYYREKGFKEWGMNSKFYDPVRMIDVPDFYLQVYTGFKTSCEVYQNFTPKILIDFASKIVRADHALYYINEAGSSQKAREMLVGRSVIASYGNYRMWRVDGLNYKLNPNHKFKVDDQGQKEITIAEYYQKRYNITIKDMGQPLIVNIDKKSGKETLLVPELVQMTGLDDDMRKDFNLMKSVATHTRLDPQDRMHRIKTQAAELANYCWDQYKIKMEQQSAVNGFVLKPPTLTLGTSSFVPDRGNYQLKDPVFKAANFERWLFVYADPCKEDANYFLETLKKCSGAFAIKVGKPKMVSVRGKNGSDLREAILANLTNDTQIVVAMYPPGAKKHWYKALKDVCCKEKGVPCQAVVSASLKKNAMSVCSKILLQMNAKIGMELWVTQKPDGLPDKTMIIGADVYHSTKIGEERKSCIGFCASINPEFSKFFSKVSIQNRVGEEIMSSIGKLVKEAVLKYFAFNGKKFLPECIIFFRDGLADNQLNLALEFETKAILDQLKSINADYKPKFAEVVVTKRIDDRIFSTEGAHRGGRGGSQGKDISNPPAGTVVADTIVSNNFDYLVVAQQVTQGTCTPTRFNVIYDSTGLSQDVFWQLSYWQTYNYFNWNGSVRVPAPVQYAHKLAYLIGQTVQGNVDDKLVDSLYYL